MANETLQTVVISGANITITGSLPTGTNTIGKIVITDGTNDLNLAPPAGVSVTPVISNGAIYASGDCVGGHMTFTNLLAVSAGWATIELLRIVDLSNQAAFMKLWLFDSAPTAWGNNNAFAPVDADYAKLIDVIDCGPYHVANARAVSIAQSLGRLIKSPTASRDIIGQLVVYGTPTYTSVSALVVTLNATPA